MINLQLSVFKNKIKNVLNKVKKNLKSEGEQYKNKGVKKDEYQRNKKNGKCKKIAILK